MFSRVVSGLPMAKIPCHPKIQLLTHKPLLFVHGLPKNMEALEPDEFNRKCSEEEAEITHEDDITEIEETLNNVCQWMILATKRLRGDKLPMELEKGNEHMFLDVLKKALFSPDPDRFFERNFTLVESTITKFLFIVALDKAKRRLEVNRVKLEEKKKEKIAEAAAAATAAEEKENGEKEKETVAAAAEEKENGEKEKEAVAAEEEGKGEGERRR